MNESRLKLDREVLRDFIDLMRKTETHMSAIVDSEVPRYTRSASGGAGDAAYRGGVKVTLGAVDFDHPGRQAGQLVADRIGESANFVISVEEGARAMRRIVQDVVSALDAQDTIAADDLERINKANTVPVANPYGVPVQRLDEFWN